MTSLTLNPPGESISEGEKVTDSEMSVEELEGIIHEAGISTEEWGQGDSKTVDHLLKEVNAGETILEIVDGSLTRKTSVVRSHIFYIVDSDNVLLLREDRQRFKSDGRVRKRNLEQAVGGKMILGEEPEKEMIRGIHEGLGIDGELEIMKEVEDGWKGPSLSYPGLISEKTTYNFRTILNEDQYDPDGYVEKGKTIDTYFVWHDIEQIDH